MEDTIKSITDWLLDEGKKSASTTELLDGLCSCLLKHEVPVHRSTLGAPLLHPIAQSGFASWDSEAGGQENWFVWTPENLEVLRNSPIALAYEKGEGVNLNLKDEADRQRFGVGVDLFENGYHAYQTLPLQFSDNTFKVWTVATKNEDGFCSRDHTLFEALVPPLSLALELLVQKNTAKTLVNTYVGTRAGQQVLDGEIHRGDGASINAVIWFSDLRGFTKLSNTMNDEAFLNMLNRYFETVVRAIEESGGEVLKFIGDAVLGIFPIVEEGKEAAHRAMKAALSALSDHKNNDVSFAVALHYGDVFFGNVGSKTRLDFTVIGSAVNKTSRIEGLCASLELPLLLSSEFTSVWGEPVKSCGSHALKGFEEPIEVFAPMTMKV